jgi:hypothetical protein
MKLCDKYELAVHLGVSHHTITDWRKRRFLPYIKTGYRSIRYNVPACEAALKALEIRPGWDK